MDFGLWWWQVRRGDRSRPFYETRATRWKRVESWPFPLALRLRPVASLQRKNVVFTTDKLSERRENFWTQIRGKSREDVNGNRILGSLGRYTISDQWYAIERVLLAEGDTETRFPSDLFAGLVTRLPVSEVRIQFQPRNLSYRLVQHLDGKTITWRE